MKTMALTTIALTTMMLRTTDFGGFSCQFRSNLVSIQYFS